MLEIKNIAIFLPILASLTTVAGQLLYKHAANVKGMEGKKINWLIFLSTGNLLFLSSVVCNFVAMKFIDLFIVYSFTALNYVFVTIASSLFLQEAVRPRHLIAACLIASGVFLTTTAV
jgi:drug/metabolite transporter (DMT)-like permease